MKKNNTYYTISIFYAAIILSILLVFDSDAILRYAADGETWLIPAQGLARHFSFVHPDDTSELMNYRPPLYPLFVASGILTAGENFNYLIVIMQISLLFATGCITARLTEMIVPGYGPLALALLIFNPNSLGTAFFVQSETLNAFFIALLIWCLFIYSENGRIRDGFICGLTLGLACLTRPEAIFLFVLIPISLPILDCLRSTAMNWRRTLASMVMAIIAASAVTAPWMTWNSLNGAGYRLAASGSTEYYIWGSAAQIEMTQYRIPESIAEQRVRAIRSARIEEFGDKWNSLTEAEKDSYLTAAGLRHILTYEPSAIAKNITLATLQFFTAGGAGQFFALTGNAGASPYAVMQRLQLSDHLDAVLAALDEADLSLLLIWCAAMAYVVITRIIGLAGLYRLWKSRQFGILFIIVAGLSFYALVIPFYGISRFRVAVECLLVLLTVAGLAQIRHSWQSSKTGTKDDIK